MARSGWPAGVAATASRPVWTASASTAVSPVRSYSTCRAIPRLVRCSGAVGVAGGGGGDGVPAGLDRLGQHRGVPGALDSPAGRCRGWSGTWRGRGGRRGWRRPRPGRSAPPRPAPRCPRCARTALQGGPEVGQEHGAVGVAGGGGGDRVPAGLDRLGQHGGVPGPLGQPLQGVAEVGQVPGAVGVAGGGGGDGVPAACTASASTAVSPVRSNSAAGRAEVGQAGVGGVVGGGGGDRVPAGLDRLGQQRGVPGPLGQRPQGDAEVGQDPGAAGVVGRGGGDGVPAGLDRLGQQRGVPGPFGQPLQGGAEVGQDPARSGWPAGVAATASRRSGPPRSAGRYPRALGQQLQGGPEIGQGRGASGWPAGVAATASRPVCTASVSTAVSPVRSDSVRRAVPRLDSAAARSGWSAGMAATASRPSAPLRSAGRCPRSARTAPAGRSRGWPGTRRGRVAGGGGGDRGPAGLHRLGQHGGVPGPLGQRLQGVPEVGQRRPDPGGPQGWRRPRPGRFSPPRSARPYPRYVRTAPAGRPRGWTGAWPAPGDRRGRRRPRPGRSGPPRSAPVSPVRSDSACRESPRLDRHLARSGWPAGVAATASRLVWTASVSAPVSPGARPARAGPEVGQEGGAVGVAVGGSGYGGPAGLYRLGQRPDIPGPFGQRLQSVTEVVQAGGPGLPMGTAATAARKSATASVSGASSPVCS